MSRRPLDEARTDVVTRTIDSAYGPVGAGLISGANWLSLAPIAEDTRPAESVLIELDGVGVGDAGGVVAVGVGVGELGGSDDGDGDVAGAETVGVGVGVLVRDGAAELGSATGEMAGPTGVSAAYPLT